MDGVNITSGRHAGWTRTVEDTGFQNTVDYPDQYADGFHIALDDGTWVTVRRDQVLRESRLDSHFVP